jgi:cytochrome c biogenesis protein
MMTGLVVSLLVRRRRIWIRLQTATPGNVNVQVGGLARTDNAGWGDEFERLVARLQDGLPASSAEPVATGRSTQ